MADLLPPLPVDDVALDLYWSALQPGPEAERSSIGEVLALYAEMSGSDLTAVEEVVHDTGVPWEDSIVVMRDPVYHPNDLIRSLIAEVRRLRAERDS
jgi:hypothetical protein